MLVMTALLSQPHATEALTRALRAIGPAAATAMGSDAPLNAIDMNSSPWAKSSNKLLQLLRARWVEGVCALSGKFHMLFD